MERGSGELGTCFLVVADRTGAGLSPLQNNGDQVLSNLLL